MPSNTPEYERKYYQEKRKGKVAREYIRSYYWRLRKRAVLALGDHCVNCGETNILVLQINHLEGGGGKERKKKGYQLYQDIVKGRRYLSDLDVRCANCNILYEYERGARKSWPLNNLAT